MVGELLTKLKVRPGVPVTQETLEEAKNMWLELYLFFMLLSSTNPIKQKQLGDMKTKLAETNELITGLEI